MTGWKPIFPISSHSRKSRPWDPHICSKSHAAVAIARRKIEVGDATVAGMAWVDGKMRRTVELQIWADDTKSSPTREALPSVDF